jgi:hypothetical protein
VEGWSCGGAGRASAKTGLCIRQFFFLRESDSITWDGEVGLAFSWMILGCGQEDNGFSLELVQMKTKHGN